MWCESGAGEKDGEKESESRSFVYLESPVLIRGLDVEGEGKVSDPRVSGFSTT